MSAAIRSTLAITLVALLSMTGAAAVADSHGEKSHRITAKGDKCVEPTDVMRRNHMDFILHQRDDTLRRGIRTSKHSLKECINCHADPKTNSVIGEDGFCAGCHEYAAVSVDCFSCHNDKAETKQSAVTHPAGDTTAENSSLPEDNNSK
ncbi:MAG: hypothetical protein OEZ10_08155 [Gammaproteobacteria bacterium]|nr:hypothetical protein [Gammaproteobacteria bacterium]